MMLQTYREPAAWREGAALEPLGAVEKEEAHRRGLLHRSVHLLVVDDEGGALARLRSRDDARYAGRWTSTLGTHVPAGATDEATLRSALPAPFAFTRVGEFRVRDDWENEVCGLFLARAADAASRFGPAHRRLGPAELDATVAEGRATPHLAEAVRRWRAAR